MSTLLSSHSLGMLAYGISYVVIFTLIFSGILQIHYLNKAMARFESTQVVPIQFVFFTLFAILGSAILFNDFAEVTGRQLFLFILGCALIFFGVYFITSLRTLNHDVPYVSIPPNPSKPLDIDFSDSDSELFSVKHPLAAKSMDSIAILTNGLGNQSVRFSIDYRNSTSSSLPKYPVQL
eukprot:NODE_654_length_5502_cov_0.204516.p4 type:complete len:179 gc:universal NODE_654_length_5502_cov_0.204516:2086-1550(-)